MPLDYKGVMVSSTFTDLKEHRAALIKLIDSSDFKSVVMEHDSAKSGVDVLGSSLQMVQNSAVYIGIIAKKLGQIPKCSIRNPRNVSITELEFNEAVRLGRPILLFLMGDGHLVLESEIESKPGNRKKLKAFRERAKKMGPDSEVHRVYAEFNSLDEFKDKAAKALADLRLVLQKTDTEPLGGNLPVKIELTGKTAAIPKPPAFYAEPDYIGSHKFVGRESQLQDLDDWARAADPTNLLLFEAIGGNGKSMLTWEWSTKYVTKVRSDWAGRFWYSFYDRGAVMADFCRSALAYMTGRALEELEKMRTPELAKELLAQLHARPCAALMRITARHRLWVALQRRRQK